MFAKKLRQSSVSTVCYSAPRYTKQFSPQQSTCSHKHHSMSEISSQFASLFAMDVINLKKTSSLTGFIYNSFHLTQKNHQQCSYCFTLFSSHVYSSKFLMQYCFTAYKSNKKNDLKIFASSISIFEVRKKFNQAEDELANQNKDLKNSFILLVPAWSVCRHV